MLHSSLCRGDLPGMHPHMAQHIPHLKPSLGATVPDEFTDGGILTRHE
jgi:hypothetical protein